MDFRFYLTNNGETFISNCEHFNYTFILKLCAVCISHPDHTFVLCVLSSSACLSFLYFHAVLRVFLLFLELLLFIK